MSGAEDDDAAVEAAIEPHHDPWCFGCGPANPIGLQLPWDAVEQAREPRYEAGVAFDERHQGGPGLAHGGIVAAALDEAMGILVAHVAFPAVTVRMETAFRRPVPVGAPLSLHADLVRVKGRQLHAAAELCEGDEALAQATGVFLRVSLRHFLQTPAGQAQREAIRQRLAGD